MFENDYIMRMILQLGMILRRSWFKKYEHFSDERDDIERAIGDAVDMDPKLLLSLTPESVVSMLQLGSFDKQLGGYVVRALYYEADLLEEHGLLGTADLRRAQANSIADAYGIDKDIAFSGPEELIDFFNQQDSELVD